MLNEGDHGNQIHETEINEAGGKTHTIIPPNDKSRFPTLSSRSGTLSTKGQLERRVEREAMVASPFSVSGPTRMLVRTAAMEDMVDT